MCDALLLQVVIVTSDLNAKTKGTDGVSIKSAKVGNDIVVGAGEMIGLLRRLFQSAANNAEHILASTEFLLQVQDAKTVAQSISMSIVLFVHAALLKHVAQQCQA